MVSMEMVVMMPSQMIMMKTLWTIVMHGMQMVRSMISTMTGEMVVMKIDWSWMRPRREWMRMLLIVMRVVIYNRC